MPPCLITMPSCLQVTPQHAASMLERYDALYDPVLVAEIGSNALSYATSAMRLLAEADKRGTGVSGAAAIRATAAFWIMAKQYIQSDPVRSVTYTMMAKGFAVNKGQDLWYSDVVALNKLYAALR